MKLAYVTREINWPFRTVNNEIEEHIKSGWEVLTFASLKKNKLPIKNNNNNFFFRPNLFNQIYYFILQAISSPIKTSKVLYWLINLSFFNFSDFLRACYELQSVMYFSYICKKNKINHIHVHFASSSLSLGLMIGILTNTKVSCTVHAFDIFTRNPNSLKWRLKQCSFIIAISNYNVEFLKQNCGEDVAKLCHVIRSGIRLDHFKSPKRKVISGNFICTANLVVKKGHEIAIRAFSILKQEGFNFHFHIVGNGPLHIELEKLIKSLDLESNITLQKTISDHKLMQLLSSSSAFVMPCTSDSNGDKDGIPAAMMEAFACKVPVISTYISGIPELVIHKVNGLLVKDGDVQSLAQSIKYIIENPFDAVRFGETGYSLVEENYDVVKNSKMLRKIINNNQT